MNRALLKAEAAVWRKIGGWVETYPRKLTAQQITGIACFLGGRDVVDAMGGRLKAYGGNTGDSGEYREADYVAGVCFWMALDCDDEARRLTPEKAPLKVSDGAAAKGEL